jgi:hypothetical protein
VVTTTWLLLDQFISADLYELNRTLLLTTMEAPSYVASLALLPQALRTCAFFRVWCLVELVSALRAGRPVVMLVGNADSATGAFRPNRGMIANLYRLVDVRSAIASVEADRVRILHDLQVGFRAFSAAGHVLQWVIMSSEQ